MKSKDITLGAMLGAVYLVLGVILQPWSYGLIQVRVACATIPLLALFGMPGVFGVTLGHLIFNAYFASLGPFDLFSPFVFLIPRILIAKYGVKMMPIHTLAVAGYVGWMLNFYIPFICPTVTMGVLAVLAGEIIAEWYLGYVLLYPRVEKEL